MTITTPLGAPNFDPAAAYPDLDRVRGWAHSADWHSLKTFFGRLTDLDEIIGMTYHVAEQPGVENFLIKVAETEPDDETLVHTLLGARCVELAWEARTAKRANHVSREQFARMHEHLRNGEQLLIDVTAREPHNGGAWAVRLTNSRGLELGQDEARRRYDQLAKHHPHSYKAQILLLNQLYPKWGGSWEAAFAFARDCGAKAPEGTLNPLLIAEAHLERYFWFDSATEQNQYLRQPELIQELVTVAQRSVLHPAHRPGYGWVSAHSLLAGIFSEAGHHALAAPHFRALGNLAGQHPWDSLGGDKTEMFLKHRAIALRKG